MYNLGIIGGEPEKVKELFGDRYDLTDDLSQANVIAVQDGSLGVNMPDDLGVNMPGGFDESIPASKLLFAVCDLTEAGLNSDTIRACSDSGVCVFRGSPDKVKDFIESGNITDAINYPNICFGPFGYDASRIVMMMKGIDDPILLAAMIFSGMDVRAVAGGLCRKCDTSSNAEYGAALVALREPVTRIPHVDGVIKVRVLQDI